jgi:hypothetical protein
MANVIGRFGLIYILILAICFFLSFIILEDSPDNYKIGEIVGYSIMLLASITIFFAIKEFKEKHNNGQLGFIQGLKIGTLVSIMGGVGFGVYNWIYLNWLNPNFTTEYMAYSEQQIKSSGLPEKEINTQLAELAQYSDLFQSDLFNVLLMFTTVFIIGLLFTLVSSAALKTPNNNQ